MGKIIISENVSLDGVIQDPAGDEGFRHGGWAGRPAARVELWPKLVAEHPTLGEHQAKTTRQFPVFMLTRQD